MAVDMHMIVNGARIHVEATSSVSELLSRLGLEGKRVAIERNGEIVPRSAYETTRLAADDRIEIVVAVGGG